MSFARRTVITGLAAALAAPRMARTALWWLAKILYPKQFPEDLKALTRDFYRRFHRVTPSDAEIERVLEGRG